ncbi:MAG: Asp-tRNA(Asn)/Glu-tRNA(Gln) amidotransferase subunit GatC [Betaproteobacteria bacterium]|nr:Asp-tRNA(Asn)/Glu-tRNA(Gln) amidotransferase subunit GatC [Betaproteobacteria bacterium]
MSLTDADVRRIAHLARLAVSDTEVEAARGQLNGIFDMVEALRAVDTTGIEPMAHAVEMGQRLRDDAVTAPDLRDKYQAAAPAVEDGLYLVPKVIE